MSPAIWVLGEALMDCVAQPDGTLRPFMGGSPFNLARAAALRGATVGYLNPLSTDRFVEITDQTGFDVAARFVQALETAVAKTL